MTIGISREQAAPEVAKFVMRAVLVPKAQSPGLATACGRGERSAA